jgi:hypothetical protein
LRPHAASPGEDAPPAPEVPEGPAAPNDLCGELVAAFDGAEDECLRTFAEECEAIVGILNPAYLDAVAVCLDEGADPLGCLGEALLALEPALAHLTLAEAFCEECALDVPGCEDLFFVDGEASGLGVLTLPFSEEVIAEVTAECTDGLTCAIDFPSCAKGVLEERLSGVDELLCVLDDL